MPPRLAETMVETMIQDTCRDLQAIRCFSVIHMCLRVVFLLFQCVQVPTVFLYMKEYGGDGFLLKTLKRHPDAVFHELLRIGSGRQSRNFGDHLKSRGKPQFLQRTSDHFFTVAVFRSRIQCRDAALVCGLQDVLDRIKRRLSGSIHHPVIQAELNGPKHQF